MRMMLFLIYLFSFTVHAQSLFRPIIDEDKLHDQSMSRTVFIRSFTNPDPEKAVRATGVILKDGYIITNEHVIRPHVSGQSVAFHIFVNGKAFHKFEEVYLLGCDTEHDICLLKSRRNHKDSYFTLETPPFRKTSKEAPLGLFKDEEFHFNGFCSGLPKMQKAKYVDYVTNGYQVSKNSNRKADTPSLQFAAPDGDSIACPGDSGGPLFDANLYLYGIVRDFQNSTKDRRKARNYAVPMNVINEFFMKFKNVPMEDKLGTIKSFDELPQFFQNSQRTSSP